MKRIKNSMKALIISLCVLVVAAATIVTVVLTTRKKDNPPQQGQAYVLTADQKQLVNTINSINAAKFEEEKKTFTLNDGRLFVDEYGVPVDTGKISEVSDNYFVTTTNNAKEIYLFDHSNYSETIKLSKLLVEEEILPVVYENLNFVTNPSTNKNSILFTYYSEEADDYYINCVLIEIGNNAAISKLYEKTYISDKETKAVTLDGKEVSLYVIPYSNYFLIQEMIKELDGTQKTTIELFINSETSEPAFSTGLINKESLNKSINADNYFGVIYDSKAVFLQIKSNGEVLSYTFNQTVGKNYNYHKHDFGCVIEEISNNTSKFYYYNFKNNNIVDLQLSANNSIVDLISVDNNYFYACVEKEDSSKEIIYFDATGKQIISYGTEERDNPIYYSNGNRILTKEAVISTKTCVESFADYTFESKSCGLIEELPLSSYFVVNAGSEYILDVFGNILFEDSSFEKVYRINETKFIGVFESATYLLDVENNTKTQISVSSELFSQVQVLTIEGVDYLLLVNNADTYKLVNLTFEPYVYKNEEVSNITSVNITEVANQRLLSLNLANSDAIKLNSNLNFSNNFSEQASETYVTASNNQSADAYYSGTISSGNYSLSFGTHYYPTKVKVTFDHTDVLIGDDPYVELNIKSNASYSDGLAQSDYSCKSGGSHSGDIYWSVSTSNGKVTSVSFTNIYVQPVVGNSSASNQITSESITKGEYYTKIKYGYVGSSADYKNALYNSDSHSSSKTKKSSDTNNPSLPSGVNTGTIVGGKFLGYDQSIKTSEQTAYTYKKGSKTVSSSQPSVDVATYLFDTVYIYLVYEPIKYTLKVNYGKRPSSADSSTPDLSATADGLRGSLNSSIEHTYASTTTTLDTPTSWFYTFDKWVVSGADVGDGDKAAGTSIGNLMTYYASGNTKRECTVTAVWTVKTINLKIQYTLTNINGIDKDDLSKRMRLPLAGSGSTLNGFSVRVDTSNLTLGSNGLFTSINFTTAFTEARKVSAFSSSSSCGINNSTSYYQHINPSTVNSKFIFAGASDWVVSTSKYESGTLSKLSSNTNTTLKDLLKGQNSITSSTTSYPSSYSFVIYATYSQRFYNLQGGNDNTSGKAINGSTIYDKSTETNFTETTYNFATTQFNALYQFRNSEGENAYGSTFAPQYGYLDRINVSVKVLENKATVASKTEDHRAYLLNTVTISNLGMFTNSAKTEAIAVTVVFERVNNAWQIKSDHYEYKTTISGTDELVYRSKNAYNGITGMTGQYYNEIRIQSGSNESELYFSVINCGITISSSGSYEIEGTLGFKVEAEAISNRISKDLISISDGSSGTGDVYNYAVMNKNNIWVNNVKVSTYDVLDGDNALILKDSIGTIKYSDSSKDLNSAMSSTNLREGKLNNYGNTNLVVIKPNQTFAYSSKIPSALAVNKGVDPTAGTYLYYTLQSYLSQISIGGAHYTFKISRPIDAGNKRYQDLLFECTNPTESGKNPAREAGKGPFTKSGDYYQITYNGSVYNILGNGFDLKSGDSSRIFEIYLAQNPSNGEVLYFMFSDNSYTKGSKSWDNCTLIFEFVDFENTIDIKIPSKTGYVDGSTEFIDEDTTSVVYEYAYGTAGSFAGKQTAGNVETAKSGLRKFNSTNFRPVSGVSGASVTYFGQNEAYLSGDRKFYLSPNEGSIFLFHPKDGYLISRLAIKVKNVSLGVAKDYEIVYTLKVDSESMQMDLSGTRYSMTNNGFSYEVTSGNLQSYKLGDSYGGVYASPTVDGTWTDNQRFSSFYVLVAGVYDSVEIDVQTTSYIEFDFLDYAKVESGTISGVATKTINDAATGQVTTIEALNKIQILYKQSADDDWKLVKTDDFATETTATGNIKGLFVKDAFKEGTSGTKVYRVIFLGYVNKFSNGLKVYGSGFEYSSYFTGMQVYANTGDPTNKIEEYIGSGNADVTGRKQDTKDVSTKKVTNYGGTFGLGADKNISKNDVFTYVYVRNIKQLFDELAPVASRAGSSNIYTNTNLKEFNLKYALSFNVYNNYIPITTNSYLYNTTLKQDYRDTTPTLKENYAWKILNGDSSLSTGEGNMSVINNYHRMFSTDTEGVYQLDFVHYDQPANPNQFKKYTWFNDVVLTNIYQRNTEIDYSNVSSWGVNYKYLRADAPESTAPPELPNPDASGYASAATRAGNWQMHKDFENMTAATVFGYGVQYDYITIPGYYLQYLEVKTIDHGSIFINIESLWGSGAQTGTKTLKYDDLDLMFTITKYTMGGEPFEFGYRVMLYDCDDNGNTAAEKDLQHGRTSIEILSNKLQVNFYSKPFTYNIRYNSNVPTAGKVSSSGNIEVIQGDSVIHENWNSVSTAVTQEIQYDTLAKLEYQLYMPGYSFIGWGSLNYYDEVAGSEKTRYNPDTNTWSSKTNWQTPVFYMGVESGSSGQWEMNTEYSNFYYSNATNLSKYQTANTDIPYDFYIKNSIDNGYFMTDTGFSGYAMVKGTNLDEFNNWGVNKDKYVYNIENYNFWFAYVRTFVNDMVNNRKSTSTVPTINLYGVWKTNVYAVMFDANDSEFLELVSTDQEKVDKDYIADRDSLKNGSTEAKLNVVYSNDIEIESLADYKAAVQNTVNYNDSFKDSAGYSIYYEDADEAAKTATITYHCYVAFDSDFWYITEQDTMTGTGKYDTYFSYIETVNSSGEAIEIGADQQLIYSAGTSTKILNLVVDRYGYSWLGWFTKKLENKKEGESDTVANSNNYKVFSSLYGGTATLPKFNMTMFNNFEDKFDFNVKEIAPEGGEPAPTAEEENVADKLNILRFVYMGEERIYTTQEMREQNLNYVDGAALPELAGAYISFYKYSEGYIHSESGTKLFREVNGKLCHWTKDYLNMREFTGYKVENIGAYSRNKTVLTYFDTSVAYSSYQIYKDDGNYRVRLDRNYYQMLKREGEGEDKVVTLEKNTDINFRYIKLYARWETNRYAIRYDWQDNGSTSLHSSDSGKNTGYSLNKNGSTGAVWKEDLPDYYYFDDKTFSATLNNINPDRIGYDFRGWSYYYYLIDEDLDISSKPQDQLTFEEKLNNYYLRNTNGNIAATYKLNGEVDTMYYLNKDLLGYYKDWVDAGTIETENPEAGATPAVVAEPEGGTEPVPDVTQTQLGLEEFNVVPLYNDGTLLTKYNNGNGTYLFKNTYNTIETDTDTMYQEQLGDGDNDGKTAGSRHFIYLFANWKAQTFVINTSLNIGHQQLENLYSKDSRFALALYNGALPPEEEPVPAEEPAPEGGETEPVDPYSRFKDFLGINSDYYKLEYNYTQDLVLDYTGKPGNNAEGEEGEEEPDAEPEDKITSVEIKNNAMKEVKFTDIVANIYFTVTFDESLLDAYYIIPSTQNGEDVKYYLSDLFATSAGYYFLGWIINADSRESYIIKNTLKSLFGTTTNKVDNVVLRHTDDSTEEEWAEFIAGKTDDYYSAYMNGYTRVTEKEDLLFDFTFYQKANVVNYKHHFAKDEAYYKNNYSKLESVNSAQMSTNFGYVEIDGDKYAIEIDDVITSQIGEFKVTTPKLYFRYKGWKYYVYYYTKSPTGDKKYGLSIDQQNLYYMGDNKQKYIVRFDSEGTPYVVNNKDYNIRQVLDHLDGEYATKYPTEIKANADDKDPQEKVNPINLYIAVYREGFNTIEIGAEDSEFKINSDVDKTLVTHSSKNKYSFTNVWDEAGEVIKNGDAPKSIELTFVPCSTRQFTIFAAWESKADFEINIINGSNISPIVDNDKNGIDDRLDGNWVDENKNDVDDRIEDGTFVDTNNNEIDDRVETKPAEPAEPADPDDPEEDPLDYVTSATHNPGLAGYYQLFNYGSHKKVTGNATYKQTLVGGSSSGSNYILGNLTTPKKKTGDGEHLTDKDGNAIYTDETYETHINYGYNYNDSLRLNIMPYYNGRYLSTMTFTYYGIEEGNQGGGEEGLDSVFVKGFRTVKYTLIFKFMWDDENRVTQLKSLTYRKEWNFNDDGQAATTTGDNLSNYASLILYKNRKDDDIKTQYYLLKDVGTLNEEQTNFSMVDSLGLLNKTGFTELYTTTDNLTILNKTGYYEENPDGYDSISDADKNYMLRIYEYFEYNSKAQNQSSYDAAAKELGYYIQGKGTSDATKYPKYIMQDMNKMVLDLSGLHTSIDIECEFSIQTYNVDFYNVLDEEGNTLSVQAGKSNIYDTNYENEAEFDQVVTDTAEIYEPYLSTRNAGNIKFPTIPQDCSYIDNDLAINGSTSTTYNVPYGFFMYGMYFKSAFSPHRPIDTNAESEEDGLPDNDKLLHDPRYGFNYIYVDGNYTIGTSTQLFKFSKRDPYDVDYYRQQCSPVLGSTSSFSEASGIRLDSLNFYMFGGWFESQTKESGEVEFVLYNQLSEATYLNRKLKLYGYYYAVNTPTSITYYTWNETSQKYTPYTANKDQYALNANNELKPFRKQDGKLVAAADQQSYVDPNNYAKIFAYQKYGVNATEFSNDNYNEGDFNQNSPTDLTILQQVLSTYWYYEDSYVVLQTSSGQKVQYDVQNEKFRLNGGYVTIKTDDMVNFFTGSGQQLEKVTMYSEKIVENTKESGSYDVLDEAIYGANIYYVTGGKYYRFDKSSSSTYRYETSVNGSRYYFLKRNSTAGSSGFVYNSSGTPSSATLEVINNYYVVYGGKYYRITYGETPKASVLTEAKYRGNTVHIDLGEVDEDGNKIIAHCYFDYSTKRLYDMETEKEVRFLYEIYCAVNDNYLISASYANGKWSVSGIKVNSLPSPNMTYWYNEETYGLVGYIKLTDKIFEGMKRADSVFDGEDGSDGNAGGSGGSSGGIIVPNPNKPGLEIMSYAEGDSGGTEGDGTEGDGGEGTEEEPSDGVAEDIKNGILYKSFMANFAVQYSDRWEKDIKFTSNLKFAIGNYIGTYTKEQMLESFLIAEKFGLNEQNNAIKYITVNIPVKYSGEVYDDTDQLVKVEISIIIPYQFEIISTETLVEENIHAIPIYSPYLMSFDTNPDDPCATIQSGSIVIDVEKMDLWHFELTSKNTHIYNEENGDLLKVAVLTEAQMKYLKANMLNDIPTMLTIMRNNKDKDHIAAEAKVLDNRIFTERFVMVTPNGSTTQVKDWSIEIGHLGANDTFYAIAFYEKSIDDTVLGDDFENYIVRVSDNFIKFTVSGYSITGNLEYVTMDDVP